MSNTPTEFDKELERIKTEYGIYSATFFVNDIKQAVDKYVLPEKRLNPNKTGYSAASLTHGYKNSTLDTFNDGFNASTNIARQSLWGNK